MADELTKDSAGGLADEYYEQLKIEHKDYLASEMGDAPKGKAMEMAWRKLRGEKEKAEEREVLQVEIGEIEISQAVLSKRNAGQRDVVYEIRLVDVREEVENE